jgi:hypothetical protein
LHFKLAMLYPGSKIDSNLVRDLIKTVYWPIYGEMTFRDIAENETLTSSFSSREIFYGYMSTMIYVFIVNVLLLNIVIAMFRYFIFSYFL